MISDCSGRVPNVHDQGRATEETRGLDSHDSQGVEGRHLEPQISIVSSLYALEVKALWRSGVQDYVQRLLQESDAEKEVRLLLSERSMSLTDSSMTTLF